MILTSKQIANEFDLRSNTPEWLGGTLTGEEVKAYLDAHLLPDDRKISILYQCLDSFGKTEKEEGVNGVYLLAHAIHETGWGKSRIAREKFNLYGYGAFDASPLKSAFDFQTPGDSVIFVAKKIRANYLTIGGKYYSKKYGATLRGMNEKYASDKVEPNDPLTWADKIARQMKAIAEFVLERRGHA